MPAKHTRDPKQTLFNDFPFPYYSHTHTVCTELHNVHKTWQCAMGFSIYFGFCWLFLLWLFYLCFHRLNYLMSPFVDPIPWCIIFCINIQYFPFPSEPFSICLTLCMRHRQSRRLLTVPSDQVLHNFGSFSFDALTWFRFLQVVSTWSHSSAASVGSIPRKK